MPPPQDLDDGQPQADAEVRRRTAADDMACQALPFQRSAAQGK
jgi:hypothetical protein